MEFQIAIPDIFWNLRIYSSHVDLLHRILREPAHALAHTKNLAAFDRLHFKHGLFISCRLGH